MTDHLAPRSVIAFVGWRFPAARRVLPAFVAAAFAVSGAPVLAQQLQIPAASGLFDPARFPPPPVLPQSGLTLPNAVALTVEHSAVVARSRETLRFDVGRYREVRGGFDPLFAVAPGVAFTRQPLTPPLAQSELQRRTTLQLVASDFSALAQALSDQAAAKPDAALPRCPTGLRNGTSLPSTGALFDLLGSTAGSRGAGSPPLDFSDICSGQIDPLVSPRAYQSAWGSLNQTAGLGVDATLQRITQTGIDRQTALAQDARTIADGAALMIRQLGAAPTESLVSSASLDVSLFKLFRNGITLGGDLALTGQEQTYGDKPVDPVFGGSGAPPEFTTTLQATVGIPLARGRGRVAVDAPERAAERTSAGDRELLRHDAAAEVFRTTLSYLNLIAARDQVRLFEESAARQRQIADLTESAVAGGTAPEMERNRARAVAASVAARLADARLAVVTARIGLAQTIGVDLNDLTQAPVAAQDFGPLTVVEPPVKDLVRQALATRRDIRALDRSTEAAAALAAGARANLRRQVDLSLQTGFSTLYDSPLGLSGDQVGTFSPRFYSPVGYARAFTAPWGPFAVVSLSIGLPFGNHVARGRLLQADATLNQSRIRFRDLQRVVGQNVADAAAVVQRAAAALESWEAAARAARQSLDAALQRFQIGDITLIDVLLTEQELTDNLQQRIAGQQIYLSALARLRFETGALVGFDHEGTPDESLSFDPREFVSRP